MHQWQKWLRTRDVLEYCGITKRTLINWRKLGLPFSKMPTGTPLYDRDALDLFIKKFEVTNNDVDKICDSILKNL